MTPLKNWAIFSSRHSELKRLGKYAQRPLDHCCVVFISSRTELTLLVVVLEAALNGGNSLLSKKSLARNSVICCRSSDQWTGVVSSMILVSIDL